MQNLSNLSYEGRGYPTMRLVPESNIAVHGLFSTTELNAYEDFWDDFNLHGCRCLKSIRNKNGQTLSCTNVSQQFSRDFFIQHDRCGQNSLSQQCDLPTHDAPKERDLHPNTSSSDK